MKLIKHTLFLLLGVTALAQTNAVYQTPSAYSGTIENTIIGVSTAPSLASSGNHNSILGFSAGNAMTVGYRNTFLGCNSGLLATSAVSNTFVGFNSGRSVTTTNNNTFVGSSAGSATTGGSNTFLGSTAGAACTGSSNTFLGNAAGAGTTAYAGSENVYVGNAAGQNASHATLVPNRNTIVGNAAGYYNVGNDNVFIGWHSGIGTAASAGSGNVFIGHESGATATALNDRLIIQTRNAANPLIYGHFTDRWLTFNVNNASSVDSRVTINSNANGYSGLRFGRLRPTNTSIGTNGRVLTVDANGDVVLATDQVGTGTAISIVGGDFAQVTGSGAAYAIEALNIYNHDDYLRTDRTVSLNDKNLVFSTAAVSPAVAGGRIYIGEVPAYAPVYDYKLYVEKGILTEKVKVALRSGMDWADYVFADNYKLMPLKEVESFVKENKHLPGIESSEELRANGLDLADMQRKQMEKIEELTLHLIQQHKTIEKQSSEIEELKGQVKVLLEQK